MRSEAEIRADIDRIEWHRSVNDAGVKPEPAYRLAVDVLDILAELVRLRGVIDEALTLLADALPDPEGAISAGAWERRMDRLAAMLDPEILREFSDARANRVAPVAVDECPDCAQRGGYDARVKINGRGIYTCPNGHRWQDANERPSNKGYAPVAIEQSPEAVPVVPDYTDEPCDQVCANLGCTDNCEPVAALPDVTDDAPVKCTEAWHARNEKCPDDIPPDYCGCECHA